MDLHASLDRLRAARTEICHTAASWQRGGLDTAALAAPLAELQEAIHLLEALDPRESDGDRLVRFGWYLRDYYNAVRRGCERLNAEDPPTVQIRCLDLIGNAADQCISAVDRMEPLVADE